jgi:uncharacterized phage protein (TIGR01671 family)
MERVIKFRAWIIDSDRSYMQEWNNDFFSDMSPVTGYGSEFPSVEDNDIILMQFTGLHDKNGVEIYEGDIYLIDKNKGTWIVIYHECAFKMIEIEHYWAGAYCPQKDFPLITMVGMKYIEIIGNIYETPELLKGYGEKQTE